MQMPSKLKLLSTEFDIVHTDDDTIHGQCQVSWEGQAILLHKDNSNDRQASTLIHEIIEAINMLMELELKHRQITSLELGLYSAMKENEDMMMWLQHLMHTKAAEK